MKGKDRDRSGEGGLEEEGVGGDEAERMRRRGRVAASWRPRDVLV